MVTQQLAWLPHSSDDLSLILIPRAVCVGFKCFFCDYMASPRCFSSLPCSQDGLVGQLVCVSYLQCRWVAGKSVGCTESGRGMQMMGLLLELA